MKNKKTSSKLHCSKIIFHLLVIAGVLSFTSGMAQAANAVKKVYNKVSCYGSLIDQASYCTKELGRNSEVLYKTTRNGSDQTKFVFNVGYFNKAGQRYAHGYLWVKDKTTSYDKKRNYDFGGKISVKPKGVGEIGSYCELKVKGKFVAGVTLAGY